MATPCKMIRARIKRLPYFLLNSPPRAMANTPKPSTATTAPSAANIQMAIKIDITLL